MGDAIGRVTNLREGGGISLESCLERIHRAGFIAILRGDDPDALIERGLRLAEVGVMVMEVTLDSAEAARVFQTLRNELGEQVMLGVGTVMHPETALVEVAKWGAEFALSPVCPPNFIQIGSDLGILAIPGAGTPDELWKAHLKGALIIKLYPASTNWSPAMVSNLPQPLRMTNMLPTGGISPDDVELWLDSGATAVGLGANLTAESAAHLTCRMRERRGVLK